MTLLCLPPLAIVSCGPKEEPERLSREEFIARADAHCAAANAELDTLQRPKSYDQLNDYIQKVKEIEAEALGEVVKLRPPEEDEQMVQEALGKITVAMDLLQQYQQAERAGNRIAALLALQQANARATEAIAIAERYGFEECGRIPESAPRDYPAG